MGWGEVWSVKCWLYQVVLNYSPEIDLVYEILHNLWYNVSFARIEMKVFKFLSLSFVLVYGKFSDISYYWVLCKFWYLT